MTDHHNAINMAIEALQDSVDHFGCEQDIEALAALQALKDAVPEYDKSVNTWATMAKLLSEAMGEAE